MIEIKKMISDSVSVMEKVLGIKIISSELSEEIDETDTIISSVNFFGDFNGQITLLLDTKSIKKVIDIILNKYDIKMPVEDHVVFTEIINIFSGNLITKLNEENLALNITPPTNKTITEDINKIVIITLHLEENINIKIKYTFKEA
ncbi:chemotaxis protein CheX [Eubacteriales bacterium OttesenSCG-928-G02]|nr:chemotaxis protein CheX [Eubacteriales bacterium OttesenSCG-928-G02]